MNGAEANTEKARARLARHLRAHRRARKLTQKALGAQLGMHRTYVGALEQRRRNVLIDNIERLAQALDVDICDLLSPDADTAG